MDLVDRLRNLSEQALGHLERLRTEEATKNALVMPFINALGYNVFDPSEVIPEFTADIGTKKGEKVDYALIHGGEPAVLFECKAVSTDLDTAHASQLYRYFSVTPARFGVLTNGLEYRFFSDLEAPNRMDERPFLVFDIRQIDERLAEELKKFLKHGFDLESILSTATDLKYTRGIKRVLAEEWVNPSDDFIRLMAGRVYDGNLTQRVREQFAPIVRKALHGFVHDRVQDRLQSALDRSETAAKQSAAEETNSRPKEPEPDGIETTEEELEGFYIVKAVVGETVDLDRVFMRDTLSYCGILLDDNNRKPICRLFFNGRKKSVGLFDDQKRLSKQPIDRVSDLYRFADQLRNTARQYDQEI